MGLEEKVAFIKGNEAVVEAALRAGVNGFFGYPITPASEISEGMAKAFWENLEAIKKGGKPRYPDYQIFLQMESEIASINAVFGGAATGKRVMTASSGPGMSLKQEAISFMAGAEVPAVIVNVMRGGPGLGNISGEQSDYFQTVKGGGHGDYKVLTLAPNSVQEMADLTSLLFNLTDKYRSPGILLADGYLGQMKEGIIFPETKTEFTDKSSWCLNGAKNREKHVVNSLFINQDELEAHKIRLKTKFDLMEKNEIRFEEYKTRNAEIIIASYGVVSRIAKDVVDTARKEGMKVGLIRPISLWPFPQEKIRKLAKKTKAFLTLELSFGQMVEDVKLAVNGQCPVHFYGRYGGNLPTEEEIIKQIKKIYKKK
ncbi:3-methyl-2-oxobutanoate dehydrogenase subunit VorB [Candidatus Woesearchaeota archaeon]|nr:3-methyl-2-oxobutanoate dehydrogenase subunit VorB [Candidatus Woesearchaeota archaeon]